VSYVVDLVLLEEPWCDDPGSFRDNFVRPLAVANAFTSFLMIHYRIRLVFSNKLVGTDTNQQTSRLERQFGLTQLQGMTVVEEVVDAVSVYHNGSICGGRIDRVIPRSWGAVGMSSNDVSHPLLNFFRGNFRRVDALFGRVVLWYRRRLVPCQWG